MGPPLWGSQTSFTQTMVLSRQALQAGRGLSCPTPRKPSITPVRTEDKTTCACPPTHTDTDAQMLPGPTPLPTSSCHPLSLSPFPIITRAIAYFTLTGTADFIDLYFSSSSQRLAFYRRSNWGSERFINLPKVTQFFPLSSMGPSHGSTSWICATTCGLNQC